MTGMAMIKRIAAGLVAATAVVATGTAGLASTFVAWQVNGVAANDVLMIRAYPSPQSKILVGYPDGIMLSMTGRCTGGVDLAEIQGLPAWKQRQMVSGQWCELWFDPYGTGEFRNGWVFGRYLKPA